MARLNINVDNNLLAQLRIIAAVDNKTVTDIVTELITAYVKDKKKDALQRTTETLTDLFATVSKTQDDANLDHNGDADNMVAKKTAHPNDDRFDGEDKTVVAKNGDLAEEHLIMDEQQQVTAAEKQQRTEKPNVNTLKNDHVPNAAKLLLSLATAYPEHTFTGIVERGNKKEKHWYLKATIEKINRELAANGLSPKQEQPLTEDHKKAKGYRLPSTFKPDTLENAPEPPQYDGTDTHDL